MTLFVEDLPGPARNQGEGRCHEGEGDDDGPVFIEPHLSSVCPSRGANQPEGRWHGRWGDLEQLAEPVVPDWPGDKFRLIRERSDQNRMHMPGGDCRRLYWWSRLQGGNGTEDLITLTRNSGVLLSSRLRGLGKEANTKGREGVRWD